MNFGSGAPFLLTVISGYSPLSRILISSVSFSLFHTLWYTGMPESIVCAAIVKLYLFMSFSNSACAFSVLMVVASYIFGKTIKPEKGGKVQRKGEELAIKTQQKSAITSVFRCNDAVFNYLPVPAPVLLRQTLLPQALARA